MLTVCPIGYGFGFGRLPVVLPYSGRLYLASLPFGLTGAYSVGACIALSTSPASTAIMDALERDIGKGDTLRHTPAIRLVRRLTSVFVALSMPR
jgi:hypothetical protein